MPRARFPRTARLGRKADFDAAFAAGRRASAEGLLVVVRPNGLEIRRLGVSVGRRFGGAVRRNRAKRLLREAFRLSRESLPAGIDVVAVPRSPHFPDSAAEVRELLEKLVRRAGAGRRRSPP